MILGSYRNLVIWFTRLMLKTPYIHEICGKKLNMRYWCLILYCYAVQSTQVLHNNYHCLSNQSINIKVIKEIVIDNFALYKFWNFLADGIKLMIMCIFAILQVKLWISKYKFSVSFLFGIIWWVEEWLQLKNKHILSIFN